MDIGSGAACVDDRAESWSFSTIGVSLGEPRGGGRVEVAGVGDEPGVTSPGAVGAREGASEGGGASGAVNGIPPGGAIAGCVRTLSG